MALNNKAKDALMAGANKAKQAVTEGASKVKDNAITGAKNTAINGADKANGGAVSKAQQAIKLVKKLAQIAWQIIRMVFDFIVTVIHLLFNPITWWVLLGTAVLLIIVAIFQVYGPTSFKYDPGNEALISLEEIEDNKKSEIASLTFSQHTKINNNVSAYLGKLFEKNKDKLTYINKTIPEGCDSKCILDKVNSGEWADIELGAWKLKGENAKRVLEASIKSKTNWNKSETQMEGIISAICTFNTKINCLIFNIYVNNLLNISMSDAEVEQINEEVKSAAKSIEDKVEKVKRIGQGNCLGRTEGGKAIEDENCSGLDDGNGGSIDSSDLIEFLEEYALSEKILTAGSAGASQATDKMRAGKRKAEEAGGTGPCTGLFSSCDRLVAAALKATKIDTSYPWGGVVAQDQYLRSHPEKWKQVKPEDRKSGDVIVWLGGGVEHTAIYGVNKAGKKMVYQASFQDYLPHKAETSDRNYDPDLMVGATMTYWRFVGKKG